MKSFWIGVASYLIFLHFGFGEPISITGSNGRAVPFLGIKSAMPGGLITQLAENGPETPVRWEKIDISALQQEHPKIYAAYLSTQQGETVELNLGTFAPPMDEGETRKSRGRYPGWNDYSVGGITFALQVPPGEPKGILLLSIGDFGDSIRWVQGNEIGSGPFSEFQVSKQFALLSYHKESARTIDKIDDFVFAEKQSGAALERALEEFGSRLNKPQLTTLPIAVYGRGRTGGAFAYNFVQYRPERVIGASIIKGAFYESAMTEASSQVPMMLIWGEYNNQHEIWQSEHYAQTVLKATADSRPLWSSGMEARGSDIPRPEVEHFAKEYLKEVIELRLVEAPPAPAPPVEDTTGEGEADSEGEADDEEETGTEDPEPTGPTLAALDRADGYIGVIKTGKVSKVKDPSRVLDETETWLPNQDVARMWAKFVTGELVAPDQR
ncbi:MAG: hypothetical protein AAF236_04795 [Verrucomicrobiota bacterium]